MGINKQKKELRQVLDLPTYFSAAYGPSQFNKVNSDFFLMQSEQFNRYVIWGKAIIFSFFSRPNVALPTGATSAPEKLSTSNETSGDHFLSRNLHQYHLCSSETVDQNFHERFQVIFLGTGSRTRKIWSSWKGEEVTGIKTETNSLWLP